MPLPVVLFALFTAGFWVPCLVDVATTPRYEFQRLSKGTWLLLVAAFWVFGAVAWLLIGRPAWHWREPSLWRDQARRTGPGPQEALRRHPAGRDMDLGYERNTADGLDREAPVRPSRMAGPDDDPEFLLELDRRIREDREDR
jgi:Phospholipase_D-nuclease N-terminal